MCRNLKAILLLGLFASLLVVPLHSQSVKDQILSQIASYQTTLQIVKQQIAESQAKIASSENLIADLQKQLADSKLAYDNLIAQSQASSLESQQIISNISNQLEQSKTLLEMQKMDLETQKTELIQLSKDCQVLQNSLKLYRSATIILSGVTLLSGGYIVGHCLGLWK